VQQIRVYPATGPQVDVWAANTTHEAVQTAIDDATSGQTVGVPAGSATWTTQVSIPDTKGITLQGAGVGQTIITSGLTSDSTLLVAVNPANPVTRVTGITFDGDLLAKEGDYAEIWVAGYGLASFRIDHCHFDNLRTRGIHTNPLGRQFSGVIDHNTFTAPGNYNSQAIAVTGDIPMQEDPPTGPQGCRPFARAVALGGAEAVFIENNTFAYAYPNDGFLDSYGGARWVFRYNGVHGCSGGCHGADSGGYRGIRSFEVYENTFDKTGDAQWLCLYFRSGVGVVYNNTATGNYNAFCWLNNYRSNVDDPWPEYNPWGACDGTKAWDGNGVGTEGYPGLDQVGTAFTDTLNGTHTHEPIYAWSNTLGGNPVGIAVHPSGSTRLLTLHVLEDRDFYNDTERPGYTAYTYPHPLVT